MINTNPLLSAALQQQLKKPLSVQAAAFTFLLFEQKKKLKSFKFMSGMFLQNFLQLKNYFLRSWLCPFHCPSGSLPAAPWLTLCYSATSVAGAAANWYRR